MQVLNSISRAIILLAGMHALSMCHYDLYGLNFKITKFRHLRLFLYFKLVCKKFEASILWQVPERRMG